ncbi:MAG: DNA polymerase III subunit beta [Bacteroidales bacterium]|nr:DNA polymerase III subunit beta [Bacteroidales bacterium]MCF8405102.1 DNA polymerase III subunit beta [Bacteroidales bacterium]
MKFIVSSTVLLKNLQLISGVINPSNTLPILDNFLFELEEKSLKITASDLETTMTVKVDLDMAEEPGVVAVPAKILLDTLKTFADVPITITINKENLGIEISAGEGKFKLTGQESNEFPVTPTVQDATTIKLNSEILRSAFHKTLFATGNDELRPVMSGVFCELAPEDITFVATDAHKLVRYKRKDASSETIASFILPKKPLNQLKNVLPDDAEVTIDYDQTNAFFSYEGINLVCRLIDGKYPNYDAVIPKDNPNVLTIDRAPFINSIRRVALYANQSTNQVRLKISGKELTLSAEDIDYANEAKERLTCNYEGEDIEIGFNSKFLLDMLNNIDSFEVKLEMSAPNRAGILMPVEPDNETEDILMLVMPVMLNQ